MSALEPDEVDLRRASRERALELLYEAEIKGLDIEDLLGGLPLAPNELADELVRGVKAQRDKIDEILAGKVAPRWSLGRLASVDRAILRLATYELLCQSERSQAVILNEAVILARRFGTDDSPRFVNGVLASVAADVRPESAPAPKPSVDAVIVDMDGVIRHWDTESVAEEEAKLGLPGGTISKALSEPDRLGRAMRGEITADEWAIEIGAAVAEQHEVAAGAVADVFTQTGWRIDQSVVELLEQIRQRAPVALLSNASTRLAEDLRRSYILENFDAVVSSAEIGICKPDPGAFQAAANGLDVALGRCLFVDDTIENVEAAQALGMQVHHFRDADTLAAHLATLALLPT